jgi:hypothetical protein
MSMKFSELVSEEFGVDLDVKHGFPISRMIKALQQINTATPQSAKAGIAFIMANHTSAIASTALHDILNFVNSKESSFEGISSNLTIWNGMLRSGVYPENVLIQVEDYINALHALPSIKVINGDPEAKAEWENCVQASSDYAAKLKKQIAENFMNTISLTVSIDASGSMSEEDD